MLEKLGMGQEKTAEKKQDESQYQGQHFTFAKEESMKIPEKEKSNIFPKADPKSPFDIEKSKSIFPMVLK